MEPFILDAVIEGVPSPRTGNVQAIWPKRLADQWKPVEVPVAKSAKDPEPEEPRSDVRRVWRLRDPESDLDVTVIWALAARRYERY